MIDEYSKIKRLICLLLNFGIVRNAFDLTPNLKEVGQLSKPIIIRAAFYYSSSMDVNKPSDLHLPEYYRNLYLKTSQNFAWHNMMFLITHEFYGDYEDSYQDVATEREEFNKYIAAQQEGGYADTYILLRNLIDTLKPGEKRILGYGTIGGIGTKLAIIAVEVGRALNWSPSHGGNLIAHEIGHNMFLNHSDSKSGCRCAFPLDKCIMNSISYEIKKYQSTFDSCSLEVIRKLHMDVKITINYKSRNLFEVCGNGIVEGYEQCDCGTQEICILRNEHQFCHWESCKLKVQNNKSIKCSSGTCCKDGNFLNSYTTCKRDQENECLYEAKCSGYSSQCVDLLKPDGASCRDGKGRCVSGVCITQDTNCNLFYPLNDLHMDDYCYEHLYPTYKQEPDAKCKLSFCYRENVTHAYISPYVAYRNECLYREF